MTRTSLYPLLLLCVTLTTTGCGLLATPSPEPEPVPIPADPPSDGPPRCVVTDEVLEETPEFRYVFRGKTYYFADEAALGRFKQDPQAFLR
ncbi:MAG: hypothetical protein AAF488_05175 [Planctomycetota bacterium]